MIHSLRKDGKKHRRLAVIVKKAEKQGQPSALRHKLFSMHDQHASRRENTVKMIPTRDCVESLKSTVEQPMKSSDLKTDILVFQLL